MKIKLTKSELKTQRLELQRYQRFLPTLQLKKQQLQGQVERVREDFRSLEQQEQEFREELDAWIALFAEDQDLASLLQVQKVRIVEHNVVGLRIPGLEDIEFEEPNLDVFRSPPWVDDALDVLKKAVGMELRKRLLRRELDLLQAELRKTSQRVNLFEKIKIPECRENIRIIQIALGDLQTMAVARAKLAKAKMQERSSGA